ncbi:MAG TPA: hypothetical protein VJM07_04880 [Gaiella sp.]|nr:hypothetical protein [Gaiella sp.]
MFAFGSFSVAFGAFSFGSFTFGSFDGAVAAESFPSGLPVAFGVAASFVFGDAEVGAAFGGLSFLGFGLTFGAFTLGMTGFGVVEVGFEPEPDAGGSCSPVGAAPSTGGEEGGASPGDPPGGAPGPDPAPPPCVPSFPGDVPGESLAPGDELPASGPARVPVATPSSRGA